jgi:hypothetical protein
MFLDASFKPFLSFFFCDFICSLDGDIWLFVWVWIHEMLFAYPCYSFVKLKSYVVMKKKAYALDLRLPKFFVSWNCKFENSNKKQTILLFAVL